MTTTEFLALPTPRVDAEVHETGENRFKLDVQAVSGKLTRQLERELAIAEMALRQIELARHGNFFEPGDDPRQMARETLALLDAVRGKEKP